MSHPHLYYISAKVTAEHNYSTTSQRVDP